jgi:hypothetical protein
MSTTKYAIHIHLLHPVFYILYTSTEPQTGSGEPYPGIFPYPDKPEPLDIEISAKQLKVNTAYCKSLLNGWFFIV